MPTYQYACTECGERLEAVQRFSDEPLSVCRACGGRLRKVFSPVGIVFKGSGFYRTDSRNGSAAAKAKENGSSTTSTSDSAASGATSEKSEKSEKKSSETVSTSSSSGSSSSSSSEKVA